MNHKRGKRKDARAGCLMCKWYKANAVVGSLRRKRERTAMRNEARS